MLKQGSQQQHRRGLIEVISKLPEVCLLLYQLRLELIQLEACTQNCCWQPMVLVEPLLQACQLLLAHLQAAVLVQEGLVGDLLTRGNVSRKSSDCSLSLSC